MSYAYGMRLAFYYWYCDAPCQILRYAKYLAFPCWYREAPCQTLRHAKYWTCYYWCCDDLFRILRIGPFTNGTVMFYVRYFAQRSICLFSCVSAMLNRRTATTSTMIHKYYQHWKVRVPRAPTPRAFRVELVCLMTRGEGWVMLPSPTSET